jgi:hypothetical protein
MFEKTGTTILKVMTGEGLMMNNYKVICYENKTRCGIFTLNFHAFLNAG